MNRLKFGVVLCAAVILSAACGGGFGGMGGTGALSGHGVGDVTGVGGGQTACDGDFGTDAAAGKLEAFLAATTKFTSTADELQSSLETTCKQMGAELGIPESEMTGSGSTPGAKAACDAVAAKLRSELSDLRGSAHLRIAIVATPPVCEVRVDAYAQCAGSCDASFTPGSAQIQCEGGEIRGGCSAECTGSCSVEASGSCSGSCEGSCSASCTGVCQGTCEGTCATRAADGSCNGACRGTCHGTCSAGCTGTITPPHVEADCQASCDARMSAEAECTPGSVEVTITGRVSTNLEERVNHLKAAIQLGIGNILAAKLKLERLARSGEAIIHTAGELPGAVVSLGLGAASCVSSAAAALPRATASISVSVEVSASVGGSVGG